MKLPTKMEPERIFIALHTTLKPRCPAIFVDLDGTLVWTWQPLVTTEFMSRVLGLPICSAPRRDEGYLKLTKVPIGATGRYTLTCRRPQITRFLRALRLLGEVYLLTHATREYAAAMNRVFGLGFSENQIFVATRDYTFLTGHFCKPQWTTVLLDDEGPGYRCRWKKRDVPHPFYDEAAERRHWLKCRCVGVRPNSRRDIRIPQFAGLANDLFRVASFRAWILTCVAKVVRHSGQKGTR